MHPAFEYPQPLERPQKRSNIIGWLRHALETSVERRQLTRLNSHMLDDIGAAPARLERDATRSFWDLP